MTPDLAAGLGLEKAGGVLVARVMPEGPASQSDLRAGDVILSVNGRRLQTYKELPRLVAATHAGSRMKLEVLRDGKPRQMTVTVGQMPDDHQVAALPRDVEKEAGQPQLGLYLAPLTSELRLQQGIGPNREGVFVAQVEPDSPAARAGIEAGSLISMVGSKPVDSPDQLQAAVRKAAAEKRQALILRVEQDGKTMFVAVPFVA